MAAGALAMLAGLVGCAATGAGSAPVLTFWAGAAIQVAGAAIWRRGAFGKWAPGADRLARRWAEKRGIHFAEVPALWDFYGRQAAGPLRNVAMAFLMPDLVVAFPGGSGTASMVQIARQRAIEVIEVPA